MNPGPDQCIEYSTMVATWLSTIATWLAAIATCAAVVAAVWAGKWAKRTFVEQAKAVRIARDELSLTRKQLADAQAKDQQENQLRRFRYGPHFIVTPHFFAGGTTDSDQMFGENPEFIKIYLIDTRNSFPSSWNAWEIETEFTRELQITRTKIGTDDAYCLRYETAPSLIRRNVMIRIGLWFSTADGYEDIHIFEHQIGTKRIFRVEPALIRLHDGKLPLN